MKGRRRTQAAAQSARALLSLSPSRRGVFCSSPRKRPVRKKERERVQERESARKEKREGKKKPSRARSKEKEKKQASSSFPPSLLSLRQRHEKNSRDTIETGPCCLAHCLFPSPPIVGPLCTGSARCARRERGKARGARGGTGARDWKLQTDARAREGVFFHHPIFFPSRKGNASLPRAPRGPVSARRAPRHAVRRLTHRPARIGGVGRGAELPCAGRRMGKFG